MATQGPRHALVLALAILLAVPLLPPAGSREPTSTHLVTLVPETGVGSLAATHKGTWRSLGPDVFLVHGADARELARDPRVVAVEPDPPVRAAGASGDRASWDRAGWDGASWDGASWDRASWDRASWDRASWDDAGASPTFADPTWGYRAIRASDPVEGGKAALICLVDSGIDAGHPNLSPSLWRDEKGNVGVDFVRNDTDPDDEAGHGTHLAGIIAATAGGPMRGVSDARLANAKILDASGTGSTSDLIAALAWCSRIRADVILLALTEDAPTKALGRALHHAKQGGSVIVASAGNAGPCDDCVSYPASDPHVLAVASVRPDLAPSSFSARGREGDLALPGSLILSTYPGNAWRVGSGTSQAAAYAAGAIAAMMEDGLDPKSAVKRIEKTATDLAQKGRDPATGHGLPDLASAKGVK